MISPDASLFSFLADDVLFGQFFQNKLERTRIVVICVLYSTYFFGISKVEFLIFLNYLYNENWHLGDGQEICNEYLQPPIWGYISCYFKCKETAPSFVSVCAAC
jgi:hypothetical protein